jgi:hypothetical protein
MQCDVVDANRSDGGGFIVESDELLSAFLELEQLRVKFRNAGRSSYFWRTNSNRETLLLSSPHESRVHRAQRPAPPGRRKLG